MWGDSHLMWHMRQKSKTEIEIDKTRETILMDAFMKVLNKKEAKNGYSNSEDGGIGEEMVLKLPEANLVTNLLLIDDIILMLHKVKNENFNFITKQIEENLYKKSDNVSGDLIEDTKILMQFYNEKNQKLRKLISRMKSRDSSLGNAQETLRKYRSAADPGEIETPASSTVETPSSMTKKTIQQYVAHIMLQADGLNNC